MITSLSKPIVLLALTLLIGCSNIVLTEKAQKVQLHNQTSSLLDKCKKIGPVDAVGSAMWTVEDGIEEAKIGIREKAFDMGADTAVFLNLDHTFGEIHIQGMALKCY